MSGNYRPRRRHGTSGSANGDQRAKGERGRQASRPARRAAARRGPGAPARRPDPRRTAYDVLAAVRDREAYANLLLPRLLADRQLTGRDAALATELAYGTLRGQGTYDAILAACSDRPLDKLDPPVLDVLRLGAHQLLSTRIGAHAAVATSVDLAKSVVGPRVSGYVNAVLRRVATRDLDAWLDIVAPSPAADPDGYLATRYSHPRWIVAAYRAALGDAADGPAQATAIPDAPGQEPSPSSRPPWPRATPGRGSRWPHSRQARPAMRSCRPAPNLAAGPRTRSRFSPATQRPLIECRPGRVQDEGSQLAAMALSRAPLTPRPGQGSAGAERWLDMCAGPGGKSRLLYGLAQASRATLTAAELHPHRAALVRDALIRASRLTASAVPPASGEEAGDREGSRRQGRKEPNSRWSSRTAPGRPGPTAPSTGCSWTPRARASARCAAAPRPAGASRRTTSRSSPPSSATCSARP